MDMETLGVNVPLVKNLILQLSLPSSITVQFPVYVKTYGEVPILPLEQLYEVIKTPYFHFAFIVVSSLPIVILLPLIILFPLVTSHPINI